MARTVSEAFVDRVCFFKEKKKYNAVDQNDLRFLRLYAP